MLDRMILDERENGAEKAEDGVEKRALGFETNHPFTSKDGHWILLEGFAMVDSILSALTETSCGRQSQLSGQGCRSLSVPHKESTLGDGR